MKKNKSIVFRQQPIIITFALVQFLGSFISISAHSSFQAEYGNNAINYVAAVHLLRTEILKQNPTQIFGRGDITINNITISKNISSILQNNLSILNYYDALSTVVKYDSLIKIINAINPDALKISDDKKVITPAQSLVINNLVQNTTSGASNGAGVSLPFEARVINAATELIIDRLQQELALTFFRNFKENLKNDDTLRILLPRTYEYLTVISEKTPLIIPSLGAAWRGAFEQDLREFPLKFAEFHHKSLNGKGEEYANCMRILYRALETYKMIKSGRHPADIIHHFRLYVDEQLEENKVQVSELQHTVRLLDHLSQNLLSGNGGWASRESLKLLENKQNRDLFLAILVKDDELQNITKLPLTANHKSVFDTRRVISVDSLVKLISTKESEIRILLNEFQLLTASVENSITTIRNKQDKALTVPEEDYYGYVRTVFDAIKFGQKLLYLRDMDPATININRKLFDALLVPIGESAGEMMVNIAKNNYGAALGNFLGIVSKIQSSNGAPSVLLGEATKTKLIRYTSFLMDVINAKDVEQTKAALQAAALPVGSYSLKRNSGFSVNISSYPGLNYGWEQTKNEGTYQYGGNYFGVYAPIGVDLSVGCGSSLSLFLGIVDLGTLVSYRLSQQDSVKSYPIVDFKQIFAPSVGFQFGIAGTPLTIGWTWQIAPRLREVTSDNKAIDREKDAFRCFFNVSVDLNLFNLYTSEKTN